MNIKKKLKINIVEAKEYILKYSSSDTLFRYELVYS